MKKLYKSFAFVVLAFVAFPYEVIKEVLFAARYTVRPVAWMCGWFANVPSNLADNFKEYINN